MFCVCFKSLSTFYCNGRAKKKQRQSHSRKTHRCFTSGEHGHHTSMCPLNYVIQLLINRETSEEESLSVHHSFFTLWFYCRKEWWRHKRKRQDSTYDLKTVESQQWWWDRQEAKVLRTTYSFGGRVSKVIINKGCWGKAVAQHKDNWLPRQRRKKFLIKEWTAKPGAQLYSKSIKLKEKDTVMTTNPNYC